MNKKMRNFLIGFITIATAFFVLELISVLYSGSIGDIMAVVGMYGLFGSVVIFVIIAFIYVWKNPSDKPISTGSINGKATCPNGYTAIYSEKLKKNVCKPVKN